MSENLLKHETSPYLLQHKDNPVQWRAWGPQAFEEARRAGKPILLSVGYAACHWCHVMAHESFEDPEVAAVMNDLYVNIKVDREERPDVDQLYMNALQLLGEHPGWPLTMFLTPDGDAIWGGTYFPKEARYGRPGFLQVLREFSRIFHSEPGKIEHNRQAIRARLLEPARSAEAELTPELIIATGRRLLGAIDATNGGLRGAPKFPQAPLMQLLWHTGLRSGDAAYFIAVEHSLRRMARGGIYDHVGGGFSRYAVDERWLVPHFEKMLYDNALLIDLLTFAWLRTGDDLFRIRIAETVDWLRREMIAEAGGFSASLDADSDGHEGLFYTWTPDEIAAVLGHDAPAFCTAYDITAGGNFEGRSIANRLAEPFPLSDEDENRLADCRSRLLAARGERVPPGRDDKVLADWNGLMIAALARASTAFARPDWLELAIAAYRYVSDSMQADGRLAHSRLGEKLVFPGLSSDYAAMIGAAFALNEATGDDAYLEDAVVWTRSVEGWHWDAAGGGYHLAASDASDVAIRLKQAQDDPVPNPNAQLAGHVVRLWHLTGDDAYRDRADQLFSAYAGEIGVNPFVHAGLLCALDMRLSAVQIVVTGDATKPLFNELASAAKDLPDPNRILFTVSDGAGLPADHPAAGQGPVDGSPAAYVCVGTTCSLPVTDPDELARRAVRAPSG